MKCFSCATDMQNAPFLWCLECAARLASKAAKKAQSATIRKIAEKVKKLDRYTFHENEDPLYSLEANPEGEWISFEDVWALIGGKPNG